MKPDDFHLVSFPSGSGSKQGFNFNHLILNKILFNTDTVSVKNTWEVSSAQFFDLKEFGISSLGQPAVNPGSHLECTAWPIFLACLTQFSNLLRIFKETGSQGQGNLRRQCVVHFWCQILHSASNISTSHL